MEEYRLFQEKQKIRKRELERLISQEKAELELKHKKEKADLTIKHNQLRNDLKIVLKEEMKKRPRLKKDKYLSKKRLFEDDKDTSQNQINKKLKSSEKDNMQKKIKINDQQSVLTRIGLLTSSDSEEEIENTNNQLSKNNNECAQYMMTTILKANIQDNKLEIEDNLNEINPINSHTQEANLSTNVYILNDNNNNNVSQEITLNKNCRVYIEDNQLDISDPLGEFYENEYPLTQVEKLSNEINTNHENTKMISNQKPNEGFFSWLKK